MKKILIILLYLLLSEVIGCAQRGWVKEGSPEKLGEDYKECYSQYLHPMSSKNDTTLEKYQEDKSYCKSEAESRESKREAMGNAANATTLIPFVGLGFSIAHETLMKDDYYRRCMRAKGHLFFTPSQCMKEKGYQWK
ncbi:MAG: hypothetical protein A2V86_06610 [Deltaproteobacteria bacterium RBG_16_49_23]|nr:MAG: hypothetical protein A2V86_06610 [Deltaproteobacteria bacterium RBG_16_49_23]